MVQGQSVKLYAQGTYSDGRTTDITHSVVWTSSATSIVNVDSATSVVIGIAVGSAAITASLNGVSSLPANISVTAADNNTVTENKATPATLLSISIAPETTSIGLGKSTPFTATGTYSDGTTRDLSKSVTWDADNTSATTISNRGIAKGIGAGKSLITARLQNISSSATALTVTLSVGGTLNGLAVGNSITLANKGGDKLTPNTNGAFIFPTGIEKGGAFNLSISSLPKNQPCTHTYGAGTVQSVNVTALNVICGFPPRGEMSKSGNLVTPRRDHTTTLLPNGKILATGGVGTTDNLASTELYDPSSEQWNAAGALINARRNHTATMLINGKVLVAGGLDTAFKRLASAELFDPTTEHWTTIDNLNIARSEHTSTLLPDGKVLVTGGVGMVGVGTLSSAELYDPVTGHWTTTGSLITARSLHTAMLLPNGKVLVSGGVGAGRAGTLASAELYDPATGRWSSTGNLITARSQHTTTLLPNGEVLVAGGIGSTANLTSAELYDQDTGQWRATGSLSTKRFLHTALLLPTGKVLVAGGVGAAGNLSSTELYDPDTGHWTASGNLNTARSQHTATLLSNGKLLVIGGNGASVLAEAELYW